MLLRESPCPQPAKVYQSKQADLQNGYRLDEQNWEPLDEVG